MKQILTRYLSELQKVINRGDAREESFYHCVKEMLESYAQANGFRRSEVSILPKATEAGNPDFRVWDGKTRITGYIEAKKPEVSQLESISESEQLKRYRDTFDNLILTNFYEFWLFQYGKFVCGVTIADPLEAIHSQKKPPLTNIEDFDTLLDRYLSFSLPAITDPKSLANALAKRTRFLRDEIITIELAEEEKAQGRKVLLKFYESFKKLLINNLTIEQFADLYAQTLTYGIFVARTRSGDDFNRELIYKYIPNTLGILKSIFRFISLEEPPQALAVLIDDIADILFNTDIQKILHRFYTEGKGRDPIVHFYETFLSEYDPKLREKRGVYYTPEPVVRYIVRSIHSLLKSHFGKDDGLASEDVTILDPAAGTLTFPAEAIKVAIEEHKGNYGSGSVHKLIKHHILPHFHAIELMMAPYTVGHLKIGYLLAEHGYELSEAERFKLYLSNTLEPDTPQQTELPIAHDISEECALANKVKHEDPILVIMGNPPYSGASENNNAWTEKLLKTDLDGAQSYYTVDGMPLNEKNPKWLQDDYVKFLRFAQWKIHKAGKGIVGMITNHGYLDNPTFRGMRQSLMRTFDEIYVLDLHGNSLKKETCPDGGKDENVFDIRQGTAIILMVKGVDSKGTRVCHHELFGLRQSKYDWLDSNQFQAGDYQELSPGSPFYLFRPEAAGNEHYLQWQSLPNIFPVNSVGIVTARDNVVIQDSVQDVLVAVNRYISCDLHAAKSVYKLKTKAQEVKFQKIQSSIASSDLIDNNVKPILIQPFSNRYIFFSGNKNKLLERSRFEIMKHMLQDNLGLVINKREEMNIPWGHVFVTNTIVEHVALSPKTISYLFPLYLYPDEHKDDIFASDEREYNIASGLLGQFSRQWPQFRPEQLFYYVYAVLHSNRYRQRFAQYLRMDFPRIPFTDDYELFGLLAGYGKELADIHLLKSPRLNTPIAKYQGSGSNDLVEFIKYEDKSIVQINPDKHFEGITPELWNYHIGGYQVLHKYLKDRKGKTLANPIHYCRMATALALTIQMRGDIDRVIVSILPAAK
ncbi:MAG TPA: N-6 DNA methylase [Candidatus Syntrophosphaera sp.]|nr:N-6 DNA methylase [Candidatus Syntrophosphaera sp.]HQK29557.1 N-6 DNA methylase [Candidatus Syntrophosphaera sp.]